MAREEELRFGRLAMERGMITLNQLQEAIQQLNEGDDSQSLSSILLEKQFLTTEQVTALNQAISQQGMIGDYKIQEKIGEGGMGTVFKAIHNTEGHIRAIKVLNAEFSRDFQVVERFKREAETCTLINHPNIVRSFEVGKIKNTFYMVMEFVEGESLDEYIQRRKQLLEKEALVILKKVAEALREANSHGIIHRDIKPENILMTHSGQIKLTDFGLAKVKSGGHTSLTQTGLFLGTPYYISPEQAMGQKDLDIRSDIYSLGITLFQMLTGQLPFDGESALEVCNQHLHETIPNPLNFNENLSPEIVKLVKKMTGKNPGKRPQDPDELLYLINCTMEGYLPKAKSQIGRAQLLFYISSQ